MSFWLVGYYLFILAWFGVGCALGGWEVGCVFEWGDCL